MARDMRIARRGVSAAELTQARGEVAVTAQLVAGMVEVYFNKRFDRAKGSPGFHREMWELFADHGKRHAAVIAPRGHAKSTAGTHCYGLTELLFRSRDYMYIISNTETQAAEFLGEMKNECQNNEELIRDFRIKDFEKDGQTDWICVLEDVRGKVYKFRVMAFGSEQQVRGIKWAGKRPNFIMIDDFENKEQMQSMERRAKILSTLYSDIIPAGSEDCIYRMVATILHDDSVANRVHKDSMLPPNKKMWEVIFKRAHKGFDDFSEILWPEMFPAFKLQKIRQLFINQGTSEQYSMEYLNDPAPPEITYFRPEWFNPLSDKQRQLVKDKRVKFLAAADLAISQKEKRDYTVITVAAIDENGFLFVVDVIRGRFDGKQIVDEMLNVQRVYEPELFAVEAGAIEKAIGPFLNQAMLESGTYINLETFVPTKDKQSRARSMQAKMRAGHVFFEKMAPWYAPFEDEMRRFPVAAHDDQVDSLAYIGLLLDKAQAAPTEEEYEEEEFYKARGGPEPTSGACDTTGY